MLTFEQNASNASILVFNWTSSYDVSGIEEYELQIATDIDFSNLVFDASVGNTTTYAYTVPSGMQAYYGRVRARNGVSLYSIYSNELSDVVDITPPQFVFSKPAGVIVSHVNQLLL
jgi:hypothetical protein